MTKVFLLTNNLEDFVNDRPLHRGAYHCVDLGNGNYACVFDSNVSHPDEHVKGKNYILFPSIRDNDTKINKKHMDAVPKEAGLDSNDTSYKALMKLYQHTKHLALKPSLY